MSQDGIKIPQLLSGVADDISHIVGSEIRLARAEFKQGISETATGITMMAAAIVFAIPAVTVLAFAGVSTLTENGMQPSMASLIVALVLIVAAALLFLAGRKSAASDHMQLEKTAINLKKDVSLLRDRKA